MISDREIAAMFRNIQWRVGNEVRKEFERSGKYTKSGIKYPNLPYRSSKPFQSPRSQSGNLHSKIDVEVDKDMVLVGSDVHYLKYLEEGTRKMQPRQGLNQAYENTDIVGIIDDIVKQVFR